jgi:hypothetical protein
MLTRTLRWGRNRRNVTSELALIFAPLLHLSVTADRPLIAHDMRLRDQLEIAAAGWRRPAREQR